MHKNCRCLFFIAISVSFFIVLISYQRFVNVNYRSICISVWSDSRTNVVPIDINKLVKLTRHIVKSHRYSRSGKAKMELTEAYKILRSILDAEDLGGSNETLKIFDERPTPMEPNRDEICPEKFMGMEYGYPFYYTGFKTDYKNCKGRPLGSLVTVLINMIPDRKEINLESILTGLKDNYEGVKVIVGHENSDDLSSFKSKYNNLITVNVSDDLTSGSVWKELAKVANTTYTFVGRHLLRFDNHTSLERVLRFLSYNLATVVGTSHRFMDGKWFRGCYASAMKNYTMKFVDGYDLSYNSCIYCDYLSGPFAVRRDKLIELVDKNMNDDTVFVDMFAKLSNDSAVVMSCPDVMTTIADRQMQNVAKGNWLQFVQKWQLNRIVLPNGRHLKFSCVESKTTCDRIKGQIMPVCCLQELIDLMKLINTLCEKNQIDIELEAGSNLGAAKMYGVIPYERDADFDLQSLNHSKFAELKSQFKEAGYKLSEDDNDYKCVGNMSIVNCGYFAVRSDNWRIEMWGGNLLGSDEAYRVGLKTKTKVLVDGMWMTSQHSPAAAARNKYGDDLYQHVEHWGTLGYKTSWTEIKSGSWLPCTNPGFHGCLDLYLPVGDLQFQDVWI